MVDTTKTEVKRGRDIFYYRKRFKNRIFARLASFFAEEAEKTGITKKDIARRLEKDPAQISRWLSGPSNLTLETISDLLLALDAEADPPPIVRFKDRPQPNYAHHLIASIIGKDLIATPIQLVTLPDYTSNMKVTTMNSPSSGNLHPCHPQPLSITADSAWTFSKRLNRRYLPLTILILAEAGLRTSAFQKSSLSMIRTMMLFEKKHNREPIVSKELKSRSM